MPGGNRTGPTGTGPMTGRAAGHCTGHTVPGFMSRRAEGRFRHRGRGHGRRARNSIYAASRTDRQRVALGLPIFDVADPSMSTFARLSSPPATSTDQELDLLKRQVEYLTNTLQRIQKRITELEGQPKGE